jgi:hypothetical protein
MVAHLDSVRDRTSRETTESNALIRRDVTSLCDLTERSHHAYFARRRSLRHLSVSRLRAHVDCFRMILHYLSAT